jgi:predicted HTH domain antitoxin
MTTVAFDLSDEVEHFMGKHGPELEREMRILAACRLFESGERSLGQCAKVAGMGKIDFMDELGRRKISVIRYGREELEYELNEAWRLL